MPLFILLHKYILHAYSIWLLPDSVNDPELELLEAKCSWPLNIAGLVLTYTPPVQSKTNIWLLILQKLSCPLVSIEGIGSRPSHKYQNLQMFKTLTYNGINQCIIFPPYLQTPNHRSKQYSFLLKKILHISRFLQYKPLLFRSQLCLYLQILTLTKAPSGSISSHSLN